MSVNPDEYDSVAAVGILCDQDQFLVIERSDKVIAPGKFCFPGGRVENGESIVAALAREFVEEVQLQVSPVAEVWVSVTPWRCKVHWWSVYCAQIQNAKPNSLEVASLTWMTVDQMLACQNLLESNRHFLELVLSGEISL